MENTPTAHEVEITLTKEARVYLDDGIQMLRELPPSREVSLAITKIQEGVMWLGMNLKALGNPTPYPNSYDPTNTVVDPTDSNLKL